MPPPPEAPELTAEERAVYAWQLPVPGLGEAGQRSLKGASVLISRCGGLGGSVAYQLAAAGVGRLILAHGGNVRPGDLNRQLLMTWDWVGKPRIDSAARRLRELNPRLDVVAVPANVGELNVVELVRQADLIVDCAPLFTERFLLNREAVRQHKPMIECAVYEWQVQLTTFIPGRTPCLRCICPDAPADWTRQFPVLGGVAGTAGSLAALEVIKLLAGIGTPLLGQMLVGDLRELTFRKLRLVRDPACRECGQP